MPIRQPVYAASRLITLFALLSSPLLADDGLLTRANALFAVIPPVSAGALDDPRISLGRALFWDRRLSSDGDTACASCHLREDHGSDRRSRSTTARGSETGFHSMTVFNTQTAGAGLRWLGDRESGRAQAIGSITGSMGFDRPQDLLEILAELDYAPRFGEAFPAADEALTIDHYGEALEAYQRSLRTPAPFDDWLAGDDDAITTVQKAGLQRFIDIGCAGCHNGPLLGADATATFGLVADYWEFTGSDKPHEGRMALTGKAVDRSVFRVASLRNVAATAPYFHDASVPGLAQAVRVMARVQLGLALDDAAVSELVSFLEALTGEVPAHFSPPCQLPSAGSSLNRGLESCNIAIP